jgi:hypothetical protein
MVTATKPAPQPKAIDAFALIGQGEPDDIEAVAVIHSCFHAMAVGEEYDHADFAQACDELGISEYVAREHYAAFKSCPDPDKQDADHVARLQAADEKWIALRNKAEAARLETIRLNKERDAAWNATDLLRKEHGQFTEFMRLNQFLCGTPEEAVKASQLPSLTMQEVAAILGADGRSREEELAIRERKARAGDPKRKRPASPNAPPPPQGSCEPPPGSMRIVQVNNPNWQNER